MSWARRGWPLSGMVVLSDREEQQRRTTDESERTEDMRQSGLVMCDECGAWFQSGCLCDDFRREEI